MVKAWIPALAAVILLLPQPVLAIRLEQVPNPRRSYGGWVSDTADILSSSTERELDRLITQLEARTGAEMAVVTVPETQGYASPKAFATQLFNSWGIGKAGVNNGVLFLISVGDRRLEIETGTGLTAVLPTPQLQQIIDQDILPKFRQQDFDGGTLAGVQRLVALLEGRTEAVGGDLTTAVAPASAIDRQVFRQEPGTVDLVAMLEGILLVASLLTLGMAWQRSRSQST